MSRSEFRWNKKRKHYAYLFKDKGKLVLNILITSKPYVLKRKNSKVRIVAKNIKLVRHPNKVKVGIYYVIPKKYLEAVANAKSVLDDLLQEGLPEIDDTDTRNRWLYSCSKTFSTAFEAIEFLETLKN